MSIVHITYFQENLRNFIHVLVNNVNNKTLPRGKTSGRTFLSAAPRMYPLQRVRTRFVCEQTRRLLEPLNIPREGRVIIERLHYRRRSEVVLLRNREPPPMVRMGTSTVESAISTVRTRLAIKPAVIHVQHVTRVRVRDLTCPGPLYLLLRIYGPATSATAL